MSSSVSLQECQKQAILKMLNFNSSNTFDSSNSDWKVLIYDNDGRSIISPILKLHELRAHGVTLHLLLNTSTSRDPIPDVPAIYFTSPSTEVIDQIIKDQGLYRNMHLNFISPIPRPLLESLASKAAAAAAASSNPNQSRKISKVFDQYLNFVSLQPNVFTLCNSSSSSYSVYNNPATPDSEITAYIDGIVSGLFSAVVTAKQGVPIIHVAEKKNDSIACMIAQKLYHVIREAYVGTNLFLDSSSNSGSNSSSISTSRMTLCIFDRNDDLKSALHHPSTYQALVDDLCKINGNRVKVADKSFDLDINTDAFFKAHSLDLFPDAIAANEAEMKELTVKEDAIRSNTQDLSSAVSSLPELLKQKKLLELHTNVFSSAFEIVASRHVPSYSMLEAKLMENSLSSSLSEEVLELLSSKNGSLGDKIRCLCIYYLSYSPTKTELEEFENAIKNSSSLDDDDTYSWKAYEYIVNHPLLFKSSATTGFETSESGGLLAPVSPTAAKLVPSMQMFKGMAGNLAGHAQGFINQAAAQVKNFLPENKMLFVTRVLDDVFNARPTPGTESLVLDPKISAENNAAVQHSSNTTTAMVFMIGGGNYHEFANLESYVVKQNKKLKSSSSSAGKSLSVIYGCTELLRPEALLQQLAQSSS